MKLRRLLIACCVLLRGGAGRAVRRRNTGSDFRDMDRIDGPQRNRSNGDLPGRVGELISNVGHTNLHYGNVITYMRMLGLVPPSS